MKEYSSLWAYRINLYKASLSHSICRIKYFFRLGYVTCVILKHIPSSICFFLQLLLFQSCFLALYLKSLISHHAYLFSLYFETEFPFRLPVSLFLSIMCHASSGSTQVLSPGLCTRVSWKLLNRPNNRFSCCPLLQRLLESLTLRCVLRLSSCCHSQKSWVRK